VVWLQDDAKAAARVGRATLLPPGPVLIVAENASASSGGEAALPLAYFRFLRDRGADVRLLVHARSQPELESLLPAERSRIHYISDTPLQYWLWLLSDLLPPRLAQLSCGFLIQFITQLAQRRVARFMVTKLGIAVVHQPTPVSPRMPSMMYGLGAPVVIGPMNGGMSFPPAFRSREHVLTRWSIALLRRASSVLHYVMPGKRRAAVLLVANDRTRQALPRSVRHRTMQICENGVDLSVWNTHEKEQSSPHKTMRITFAGRLVELKGVDLLLEATARAQQRLGDAAKLELDILGEGEIASDLQRKARSLGLNGAVRFLGWQSQAKCAEHLASSDALAMPSLCECGGAVVLEAMAMGLPVIAAKWGGPADYVDPSCGVLVEPKSHEAFVQGLEDAMVRLAESPDVRRSLGEAGHLKVLNEYDWKVRIDQIIEVYHRAVQRGTRPDQRATVGTRRSAPSTAPSESRSAA
jgi:glycosyltransferase involved in cell wall biosynthesis